MRLGVALDLGSNEPVRPQIDAASSLLEAAEIAGVSSVWLGESYHSRPEAFHLPASMMALAYLAARTDLALGTAVLLARAYRPERVAHEAALLDQLCRGRLTLGLGLGGPDLARRFGTVPAGPASEWFDSFVGQVRSAWAGPVPDGENRDDGAGVAPMPVQPGGPALLIGGRTSASARRAAEMGDGYYAATNYGDALLATRTSEYRRWCSRFGRAAGTVAVTRLCLIAPTPGQARSEADAYFGAVLDYYSRRRAWHDITPDAGPPLGLVGSPDEVAAELRRYARAGVTSVQLRIAPVGTPAAVSRRTLEQLGSAVLPAIRDLATNDTPLYRNVEEA